ncbi:MAG: ABC transporter ATP-binding protein/permease [Fuerstiella sp.]|nr:ABC transporter ATP-binding protein/permease [Fuerstiella sp.]
MRPVTNSVIQDVTALISSVRSVRRLQLVGLIGLMLTSALAEVLSLGAVIPFLSILATPDDAVQQPVVGWVVESFALDAGDLRWQLTVLFGVAAVLAGVVRFATIFATARVNAALVHEIGAEVYRRSLLQDYRVHVGRNSSEIVGAMGKVDAVAHVLSYSLNSVSAGLMAVAIVSALIYIAPTVALVTLFGLGAVYGCISALTRPQLIGNSAVMNRSYTERIQAVQEGLGAIRDVLLDRSHGVFIDRFNKTDRRMRIAAASNNTIMPSPRFAVEALGMVLIGTVAYQISLRPGGLLSAIPVIGAIVMGAQRLMPLVQQMYRGLAYIHGHREVLRDVVQFVIQPVAEQTDSEATPIRFESTIELRGVSFAYGDSQEILIDVDLRVLKGQVVGFMGATGSGKSTLIDIIMGLLEPSQGILSIDGTEIDASSRAAWRQNVSHVAQDIYLTDSSFRENIAFGVAVADVDEDRLRKSASMACIADFIETMDDSYATHVGERGVRLSGGQRQRIGIARALYKGTHLLVLDEATSALDSKTERAVIASVLTSQPGMTILMIAHRTSTLRECDVLFELSNGCLREIKQPMEATL